MEAQPVTVQEVLNVRLAYAAPSPERMALTTRLLLPT
jgi:hypothetical protein